MRDATPGAVRKHLGILIVYVDDFLLQAEEGSMRTSFLAELSKVWTLAKEGVLLAGGTMTFLGIDIHMQENGDLMLNQEKFVDSLLVKYSMSESNSIKCVTMGPVPETPDVPSLPDLRMLQAYSGEFNWLATRTRPDVSYYTSLLASSCSKYSQWAFELARKILRFLVGTKSNGIMISCTGNETELDSWSDAGFAGVDTHSQSGLIIVWGGTVIVWRSSKQTVSALNTAEAELYAATLGWQIVEGVRRLISSFGIEIPKSRLYIDNKAALTIAMCGASWRTRYFATRAHRIHEEHVRGAAELVHCPTDKMIADCLTKLATRPVIEITQQAMYGKLPEDPAPRIQARHAISVDPGKQNTADCTGDGPPPASRYGTWTNPFVASVQPEEGSPLSPDVFDDLTELDMIGNNVLETIFAKIYPTQADQIPGIRAEYKGEFVAVVKEIMQVEGLDSSMLRQIISDSDEHCKLEHLLRAKLNPVKSEPKEEQASGSAGAPLANPVKSEPKEEQASGSAGTPLANPVKSEPKEEQACCSAGAPIANPVRLEESEQQASSSSGAKFGSQPVPPCPEGTEETEEAEVSKPGKKRRGKKRNRPGSNERRWNKLEEAGPP